jgi:tetratricopeptide (TPR) repeat protein
MLARLQKAADNSVDSQKSYQKVLDIEPDNEDALTGLALVYSDLGDTRKAAELLKTLAEKNPSPRSLTALAAAYEQMRDFKGAAEVLRKLLKEPAEATPFSQTAGGFSDTPCACFPAADEDDLAVAQSYLRMSQIYRQQRDLPRLAGER